MLLTWPFVVAVATLLNIPNKNIVDVPHILSRFLVLVTEIITALITETYYCYV